MRSGYNPIIGMVAEGDEFEIEKDQRQNDRRAHQRKDINGSVSVYLRDARNISSRNSIVRGQILNISEGGLSFMTSSPEIGAGDKIVVEVMRANGLPPFQVSAKVVVVNTNFTGTESYTTVGIRFDSLSQLIKRQIKSFVAA